MKLNQIKYVKRLVSLLLVSLIGVVSLYAQGEGIHEQSDNKYVNPVFGVSNYSFFDNREVSSPYQRSQTFFGSQLNTEAGLQFGPNTIMVGVQTIKDFGTRGVTSNEFTYYYHYEQGGISGAFGAFPRARLFRELPDIFVYDSIRYYNPTLQGALLQYMGTYGYAELYCNWLNKQGVGEREIFEIVTDGRFGYEGYYLGWNVQLLHFSVPRPAYNLQVYDKLMINPHWGMEKSGIGWLDSYSVEAGMMLSLNRDRRDMMWKSPIGFLGEVKLNKGCVELYNRIYAGDVQFSDYETFGAQLHRGDPYYRSGLYNRTDIRLYLLNRLDVQCYVNASFHYTEKVFDNSQQVILRVYPKL